jgi:hypothetical protein
MTPFRRVVVRVQGEHLMMRYHGKESDTLVTRGTLTFRHFILRDGTPARILEGDDGRTYAVVNETWEAILVE